MVASQVPPFKHGLERLQFDFNWQSSTPKPAAQAHVRVPSASFVQVAPFRQGFKMQGVGISQISSFQSGVQTQVAPVKGVPSMQVPPFWHGEEAQETGISQVGPIQSDVQTHTAPLIGSSTQVRISVPAFLHGLELQASTDAVVAEVVLVVTGISVVEIGVVARTAVLVTSCRVVEAGRVLVTASMATEVLVVAAGAIGKGCRPLKAGGLPCSSVCTVPTESSVLGTVPNPGTTRYSASLGKVNGERQIKAKMPFVPVVHRERRAPMGRSPHQRSSSPHQ
jgi:hypothetical protein